MKSGGNATTSQEAPTYDDRFWFAAAVAAFCLTAVGFGFAAIWTFAAEGQNAVFRAQAFSPFGIALGATVTFFTVVWRGVLSTRQIAIQGEQLEHQAEQLRQLVRQNDAKEDDALVKLLQDGAKFLTEPDKDAQVMAGIASLDALISNDTARKYSSQAMDILAEFYANHYQRANFTTEGARKALNRAAKLGLMSTVRATFRDAENRSWRPVAGFSSQEYVGGSIDSRCYEHIREKSASFEDVHFLRVKGIQSRMFKDCFFEHCEFTSFQPDQLATNDFKHCNFSDCNLDDVFSSTSLYDHDLREGENFYFERSPPECSNFDDWQDVFIEKARSDDDDIPF